MAITVKEAYFTSSNGFTGIHTKIWQDTEIKPKALFQIAHGINEDISSYDELARYLAENGYVVYGNDHLGFGESVFEENDRGFFGNLDGDKRLVDDMHILSIIMKKRYPQIPLILFGHDLGSFCARVFASDFPQELSALILSGTTEIPSSATALQGLANRLSDRLGPQMEFKNSKLKVGGMRDLLSLASSACSTVWCEKIDKNLKMLIISGANDPYNFKGRGITALCDNLEDYEFEPVVRVYPVRGHEIIQEEEHEDVFKDILKFCESI